jgi:hypothetical protein
MLLWLIFQFHDSNMVSTGEVGEKEKPHVQGSLALLCRASSSVSWPCRALQGVWRSSRGPGVERQGCPQQKGTDGCQVEGRLV